MEVPIRKNTIPKDRITDFICRGKSKSTGQWICGLPIFDGCRWFVVSDFRQQVFGSKNERVSCADPPIPAVIDTLREVYVDTIYYRNQFHQ